MKLKRFFCGVNERGVLWQVGEFGEILTAAISGGKIVSSSSEIQFADVINERRRIAIQVKMCNGNHAQRILPQQIQNLFAEVKDPFLFNRGFYALIFYRGIHSTRDRLHKSMIWSRKFSKVKRFQILANELQFIYFIDVNLLVHMLNNCPGLLKTGAIVSSHGKKDREKTLYLSRTFLAGFIARKTDHVKMLDLSFGKNKWIVNNKILALEFKDSQSVFCRTLPIFYVGSQQTLPLFKSLLRAEHPPVMLE